MKTKSFSITPSPGSTDCTQLLLEGQLVIRNALVIHKDLLSALANSQNLELIFKNIVKSDLSFLQLLIALQKSAGITGKQITFHAESAGELKSVIKKSGLEKILKSIISPNKWNTLKRF